MTDQFSRYARTANRVLFQLAYRDERRGMMPMASPTDDTLLRDCLAAKAKVVQAAEASDRDGDPWDDADFFDTLYESLESLLLPAKRGSTRG